MRLWARSKCILSHDAAHTHLVVRTNLDNEKADCTCFFMYVVLALHEDNLKEDKRISLIHTTKLKGTERGEARQILVFRAGAY